jgi:hypothetical protein
VTARNFRRLPCAWRRPAHFVFALIAVAALAGCATPKINLSQTELATLDIQRVDVSFAPNAHLWWGNAEREYAAKVGAPPPDPQADPDLPGERDGDAYRDLMDSPEAKKYLRKKLARMLQDRLGHLVAEHQGTRPARLEVVVRTFIIPSPLQRIALGGSPRLRASIVLRDAVTGQELGKYNGGAAGYAGHGIAGVLADQLGDDLEDRVLDQYDKTVSGWLSGK